MENKKIIICKECGKKYEDVGTLPQMCQGCWDEKYMDAELYNYVYGSGTDADGMKKKECEN